MHIPVEIPLLRIHAKRNLLSGLIDYEIYSIQAYVLIFEYILFRHAAVIDARRRGQVFFIDGYGKRHSQLAVARNMSCTREAHWSISIIPLVNVEIVVIMRICIHFGEFGILPIRHRQGRHVFGHI